MALHKYPQYDSTGILTLRMLCTVPVPLYRSGNYLGTHTSVLVLYILPLYSIGKQLLQLFEERKKSRPV